MAKILHFFQSVPPVRSVSAIVALLLTVFATACHRGDEDGGPAGRVRQYDGMFRQHPAKDRLASRLISLEDSGVSLSDLHATADFDREVPLILHRVLTIDEAPSRWQGKFEWEEYAAKYGYPLQVWEHDSLQTCGLDVSPQVLEAASQAQNSNHPAVVEQLVQLTALLNFGGISFTGKVLPPQVDGSTIPLSTLVNRRGLSFTSNVRPRSVGNPSIYITSAFLVSPINSEWLRKILPAAGENVQNLLADRDSQRWPARYFAGNTFLSRNLFGIFNVIPSTTLQHYHMLPQIAPEKILDNDVAEERDEDEI